MIMANNARFCMSLLLTVLTLGGGTVAVAQAPPAETQAKEFNARGIKAQEAGRMAEAAENYRKAIQLNPNGAASHNNLALVLKDTDQLLLAEQEERIALKLRPKRADYHYNLGIILQKEGKNEPAESEFREAIALDAMDPEFKYHLGQVLLLSGKYADAESELKQAIMLKPNEVPYHQLLGDILLKEGQKDEDALYEYRKVAELSPEGAIPGDVKNKIDYLKQVLKTR